MIDFTAPALHSVFLIRRLRSRSEASNAPGLRGLHDTSVQSLIGLEMETPPSAGARTDPSLRVGIDAVHSRLQQEIGSLRNLMSHLNRNADGAQLVTNG